MIRRPAFILALLTGLNLLNYMDRTVLAAVLPRVQTDLDLNEARGGWLATAFLVGYFIASPVFGWLGDRGAPRKILLALGVLVWSLATFASGHAHGFVGMLAARAIVGVGEASYAAVAPTIIDDMAPPERKGRWLAWFYLAIPVGSAIGYLLGGFIEARLGWRSAFYLVGGPGVLLATTCMFISDPAHAAREKQRAAPRGSLADLVPLLRQPLYLRAVFGYALFTFALGGFAHWAPKFIHHVHHESLERANFLFGLILVVAGLIGTGIGGVWGDRLARSKRFGAGDAGEAVAHLRVCAVASAIGAPLAVACLLSPSALGFYAFIFLCEAALFLSTSPVNAAILRAAPHGIRTSAMAISTFSIHVFGDLWSPPLVGAVADRAPWQAAMMLLPVAIAGSALVWRVKPRSPIDARAQA
jgi:MFS family permease